LSSKLDIRTILTDHLDTLRDGDNAELSIVDLVTFYGIPMLIAMLFWMLTDKVDEKAAERIDSIVVSSFSIFAALLLNVQVLIIGLRARKEGNLLGSAYEPLPQNTSREDRAWQFNKQKSRDTFIAEVFSNVSYAIAASIILVGLTILLIFCGWDQTALAKSAQLFLIIHFVLTLLMILKRMHIVLGSVISKTGDD
jgi:hypothetical protein